MPLRVRLVAQNGGSGEVEPRNSFTDAEGIATASWILGPRPGRQRAVAEFAGETETFEAGFTAFCPLGD